MHSSRWYLCLGPANPSLSGMARLSCEAAWRTVVSLYTHRAEAGQALPPCALQGPSTRRSLETTLGGMTIGSALAIVHFSDYS